MSAKNNGTWLVRIPNFEKNGYQYQENQETPSKTDAQDGMPRGRRMFHW